MKMAMIADGLRNYSNVFSEPVIVTISWRHGKCHVSIGNLVELTVETISIRSRLSAYSRFQWMINTNKDHSC